MDYTANARQALLISATDTEVTCWTTADYVRQETRARYDVYDHPGLRDGWIVVDQADGARWWVPPIDGGWAKRQPLFARFHTGARPTGYDIKIAQQLGVPRPEAVR